jgi:hypothetical protein
MRRSRRDGKNRYMTAYGYNVYPNPVYLYSKPSDKHCSNCSWWSKINKWCNMVDDPVSATDANSHCCKGWVWVVPRYLYPGMEGYERADMKAQAEALRDKEAGK